MQMVGADPTSVEARLRAGGIVCVGCGDEPVAARPSGLDYAKDPLPCSWLVSPSLPLHVLVPYDLTSVYPEGSKCALTMRAGAGNPRPPSANAPSADINALRLGPVLVGWTALSTAHH